MFFPTIITLHMEERPIEMVVLMKECGLATIWRAWATNAFRGPRPVAWGQITLMLTGVQRKVLLFLLLLFIGVCIIFASTKAKAPHAHAY